MLQILEQRPELLGISVDEDTALVVSGSHCEVLGRTYVNVAFYVSEQWKLNLRPAEEVRHGQADRSSCSRRERLRLLT